MKFEVHATITAVYEVEAEDFDEAIGKAADMSEPTYKSEDGFTYVINVDDGSDLIL